jgi:hypothetical protein
MNANVISLDPTVRLWLRTEGLGALVLSLLIYWHSGSSWWLFFGLLLTPDLAMLGYLLNPRAGAMAYNVVHSYVLPLSLAAAALFFQHMSVLPYLTIWTAHIGLDRALGYGLKHSTAFRDTHLGVLGR